MSKPRTCAELAAAAQKLAAPDAEFSFWWPSEDPSKPPVAFYRITRPGHPRENSSVTAETLRELGLEVPKGGETTCEQQDSSSAELPSRSA